MQLSPELFDEITESMTVVGEERVRSDDRRSPRVKLNTQVTLTRWNQPTETLSVRVGDFSIGGLGILHSQRIGLDEQFVVRLPRANQQIVLILCTVVYWEPLAENLWTVGASFDRVISEEELAQEPVENADASIGVFAKISQAFGRKRKIA